MRLISRASAMAFVAVKTLLVFPAIIIFLSLVDVALADTECEEANILVVHCPWGHVYRVDVAEDSIRATKVFHDADYFTIAPKGYFLCRKKTGKWLIGNITVPVEAREVNLGKPEMGFRAVVSNNGQMLACVIRMKTAVYQLAVFDLNTGKKRILLLENRGMLMPSWSPDDSRIAFYYREPGKPPRIGVYALMTVKVQGSRRERELTQIVPPMYGSIGSSLTGDRLFVPRWSPDGKKIIFEGTIKGNDRTTEYISVVDSDGKNLRKSEGGKWSLDGKKLFTTVLEDTPQGQRVRLVTVHLDSGRREILKPGLVPEKLDKWDYSLDGNLVAVITSAGKVAIMDLDSDVTTEVPDIKCNFATNLFWVQIPKRQPPPHVQENKKRENEKNEVPKVQESLQESSDWLVPGLIIAGVVLAGVVIFLLLRGWKVGSQMRKK